MEIEVGGNVTHTAISGKVTLGTPGRGGELVFSFDPTGDFEAQKSKVETAIRVLEYAKYLYANPENVPPIQIKSEGVSAKVG